MAYYFTRLSIILNKQNDGYSVDNGLNNVLEQCFPVNVCISLPVVFDRHVFVGLTLACLHVIFKPASLESLYHNILDLLTISRRRTYRLCRETNWQESN